jgi:hypothetical protein
MPLPTHEDNGLIRYLDSEQCFDCNGKIVYEKNDVYAFERCTGSCQHELTTLLEDDDEH